jgi:hypothetical protein
MPPDTPLCLDAKEGISTLPRTLKLYMVSGARVPLKVTPYHSDSNTLDTVVGTKVGEAHSGDVTFGHPGMCRKC